MTERGDNPPRGEEAIGGEFEGQKSPSFEYNGRNYTTGLYYTRLGLPEAVISCEDIPVANADLIYSKEKKSADIDWFMVNPELQGEGYGTGAYSALIDRIVEGWDLSHIESHSSEIAMVKIWIKAPLPEGWTKQFELHAKDDSLIGSLEVSEEAIVPVIDCINSGGYVLHKMERQ